MTGDDFGISLPVNEAISKAHEKGILTTASLMVAAPHTGDAVDRAKSLPDLKVGLHLVVTSGKSILPHSDIPDLVDENSMFSSSDVKAGLRMFFLPRVRQQLAAEIRAQFEAFRNTGLQLDHVNAHRHLHLHPTVLDLIIETGKDYGLTAIRVPAEPPLDALVDDRREMLRRRLLYIAYAPLIRRMRSQIKVNHLSQNDRIFGFYDSGHMDIEKMVRVISHLPDGLTELYTHPATGTWDDMEPAARQYEFEKEYKALVHARISRAIEKFSVTLTGFNSDTGH
ncbi:MAG: hopanoid biosynthesis-associated protein HpnK [Thiotrichales bacterium]|nr:hopanoid biosynthesis-associated protein HpnK [Thiotrichales bacterium]